MHLGSVRVAWSSRAQVTLLGGQLLLVTSHKALRLAFGGSVPRLFECRAGGRGEEDLKTL